MRLTFQKVKEIAWDKKVIVEKSHGTKGERYILYHKDNHSVLGHCRNLKEVLDEMPHFVKR